jgi:hypothetical protein
MMTMPPGTGASAFESSAAAGVVCTGRCTTISVASMIDASRAWARRLPKVPVPVTTRSPSKMPEKLPVGPVGPKRCEQEHGKTPHLAQFLVGVVLQRTSI